MFETMQQIIVHNNCHGITQATLRLMEAGFRAKEIERFFQMSKPFNALVTTFDDETDTEESSKVINILDSSAREWLRKHVIYAMNHGKAVEIIAAPVDKEVNAG